MHFEKLITQSLYEDTSVKIAIDNNPLVWLSLIIILLSN